MHRPAPVFPPPRRRLCFIHTVFLLYVCGELLGESVPIAPIGYEVHGRLGYRVFTTNGAVLFSVARPFIVTVDGCLWKIRTIPQAGDSRGVAYFEVGTDGTNTYALAQRDPNVPLREGPSKLPTTGSDQEPKQRGLPRQSTLPQNDAVGVITPGAYPPYAANLAGPLWLAFASHCYFADRHTNTIPQVLGMWGAPGAQTELEPLQASWTLASSPPHLPQRLECFFDDFSGALGGMSTAGSRSRPFRVALYEAVRTTNFAALLLPAAFRVTIWTRGPTKDGSPTPTRFAEYEGTVARIQIAAPFTSTRPEITAATAVQDHRFPLPAGQGPAQYMITTQRAWLLACNEVMATKGYARSTHNAEVLRKAHARLTTKRVMLSTLIIVLTLAPIIALVRRRKLAIPQHANPEKIH